MKTLFTLVVSIALITLTSCGQKDETVTRTGDTETQVSKTTAVELPTTLSLSEAPGDTIFLTGAPSVAKAGETIRIQAIVEEASNSFNETYAIMTIVNKSGQKAACPSCLDADIVKATVQVIDGSGNVIKKGLKGFHGLAPGVKVSVVGTVDPTYKPGNSLIINASGLFVHKEQ